MNNSLLHYCPSDGWAGDPMPLYHDGVWHIYYTKRLLNDNICWGHIATRDFVQIIEYPDPLVQGADDDLDARGIKTGCVIVHENKFHMFYAATDISGVDHFLHAVSDDGISFEKELRDLFPLNTEWYRDDGTWRDPCVFYDDTANCFRMYFCTRKPASAPDPFPGRIGCAISKDLWNWTLCEPQKADGLSGSMECPDVFKTDDGWAMIYYWHETRIRFAEHLNDTWQRRSVLSANKFDFMAAKQAYDGCRRILVGWIPRKDCDCSERIWGGCLAWPREMYFNAEGESVCRFVPELEKLFPIKVDECALDVASITRGACIQKNEDTILDNCLLTWNSVPQNYRLRFDMSISEKNTVVTLFLRTGENSTANWNGEMSRGYQVIFDYPEGMLRVREHYVWDQRNDLAVIPLKNTTENTVSVDLLLNGDILEINLNEESSLVYRMMKHTSGDIAISVSDGNATIRNWSLYGKQNDGD